MGGALQEVLQRGGRQTRHGVRVTRLLPLFLLLLSYTGTLFRLPSTRPALWFSFSLLVAALYSYLSFVRKEKGCLFETLSSFALLLSGVIQLLSHHWLHAAYLPFLLVLSLFYRKELVIPLSLTVPVLEVTHFREGVIAEEAFFSFVTIFATALFSVVLSRTRKERDAAKASLSRLREEAEDMDSVAGMEKESLLSQHLSSSRKSNEEIHQILLTARHALQADSVQMFSPSGDAFRLRCSSGDDVDGTDRRDGHLALSLKRRESVLFGTPPSAGRSASSHIATPVTDGSFVAGVIEARRDGRSLFGNHEVKTLEMFSRQIAYLLKKERIHSEIVREHAGLKMLHKGSASLLTSLKIEVIARNLVEASYKIAPLAMLFFVSRGARFELVHQIGTVPPEEKLFDLGNSLAGMAVRNGEPVYFSDLRSSRTAALPFKTAHAGSVFILPFLYEKEVLGILVFLSEKTNALNSYQIELLEVLGNQASSSLANAKFHHEIERLAITDGLTGLYNHRHFQERLSSELRRLQRFSDPLSLLLVDIDFFKKINDSHGHPAGDEILRGVAGIIRETVRNVDIPARYGGEEFAAVLVGTGHEGAKKMAERLRKSVMEKKFSVNGQDLGVTVSIGCATSPHDAEEKEHLIEKADQALYHAKRNGRNRCALWSEIK